MNEGGDEIDGWLALAMSIVFLLASLTFAAWFWWTVLT